jgi:hypothetical protein
MREISTELEKRIEGQKQQKKQQVKSWELFKTVSDCTMYIVLFDAREVKSSG